MDEMGLVKIPATARDIRPVYLCACLNLAQYLLKPANTAKHFWRQTGWSPEQVNKVFVAKPEPA